jgi:hypothetical protein
MYGFCEAIMFSFTTGRLGPAGVPSHGVRTGALAILMLAGLAAPLVTHACACGCGVFDVGTGAMFPDGAGGQVYAEADFMDQNRNWSGTSSAPADGNEDLRIRTAFYTVGGQYMFNRRWGVSVDLPYWSRKFTTTDAETGEPATFDHGAIGDIRLRAHYTGFSHDMSSGVSLGVKLASGDSTYVNFDPDTQIGTGSNDLLLGAYHLGKVTDDGSWNYYVRGMWDMPVTHKDVYRPGYELLGVAGVYYHGWTSSTGVRVVPLVQLTAAVRGHDGGTMGHPEDTGYTRLIASPGVEVAFDRVRIYAEAGFAFHNNMSGNQLVAKQMYKLSLSYAF